MAQILGRLRRRSQAVFELLQRGVSVGQPRASVRVPTSVLDKLTDSHSSRSPRCTQSIMAESKILKLGEPFHYTMTVQHHVNTVGIPQNRPIVLRPYPATAVIYNFILFIRVPSRHLYGEYELEVVPPLPSDKSQYFGQEKVLPDNGFYCLRPGESLATEKKMFPAHKYALKAGHRYLWLPRAVVAEWWDWGTFQVRRYPSSVPPKTFTRLDQRWLTWYSGPLHLSQEHSASLRRIPPKLAKSGRRHFAGDTPH